MILFIDTADREVAKLALIAKDKVWKVKLPGGRGLSESLPKLVDNLLKKAKASLKDLKKVVVNKGPGSFAGTRTGVAFANALAFSLNLPTIGLKSDEIPENLSKLVLKRAKKIVISPVYSKPANITKPRKRKIGA